MAPAASATINAAVKVSPAPRVSITPLEGGNDGEKKCGDVPLGVLNAAYAPVDPQAHTSNVLHKHMLQRHVGTSNR